MRRGRSAKIVATLGPASSDPAILRSLFESGVDVFRFNFSHGTHDDHAQRLRAVRRLEVECGRPIGVLLDLQGPKLRVAPRSAAAPRNLFGAGGGHRPAARRRQAAPARRAARRRLRAVADPRGRNALRSQGRQCA